MAEMLFPRPQERPSAEFQQSSDRKSQITPYNKRAPTDVICLVAYGLLSLVVIISFLYAYLKEKDQNLYRPEDPDANKCGEQNLSGYPYIYFATPFPGEQGRTVCVKKCPASASDKVECKINSVVHSCEFNISDHFNRSNQFIVYPTKTNSFIYMCQPESKVWVDALNEMVNTNSFINRFEYITACKNVIFFMCPIISVVLVALYVFLITRIKDLRLYFKVSLVVFLLLMVAFGVYCFTPHAKRVFPYTPYIGFFLLLSVVLFVVYVVCRYGSLASSIDLINNGAIYIRENRGLIFISLGLFVLWVLALVIEVTFVLLIYSIDSSNDKNASYKFPYIWTIQNNLFVNFLVLLAIVHFFWTMLIINSIGEYLCMASGTFWILNIKHNFKNSLYSMLRFHMGSVVLGSLVNCFLGKMSELFYFFMPDSEGSLGPFPIKIQCLSNFYKSKCFMKYLGIYTDLNYIRVAMKGHEYLVAGEEIAEKLVYNLQAVYKAYRLARIIVITNKLLVAFLTTFICYIYIEASPNKNAYFITNIILFIVSWAITSLAFDSYDRSFEVILITVLFCTSDFSMKETSLARHFLGMAGQERDDLFNQVLIWYRSQKKQEAENSGKPVLDSSV